MNIQAFFERFKSNRLAYYASVVWLWLCVVAVMTPLIANDKPLVVFYQSGIYFPIAKDYPETLFGGEFDTEADYKDPAVIALIDKHGTLIMPPVPYNENTLALSPATPHPSAPAGDNWLGTDEVGRDVFARTLYGLRISILFGLCLTVLGSVIGLFVGAVMGYFGGWVDLLGQRFIEIWFGLPQLFILMILSSVFESSAVVLFGLMLLFSWLTLVPVVRTHFLKMRTQNFILIAKNMGVPSRIIIVRHLLSSAMVLSLAQMPFALAGNITVLTALDFLGVGLPVGSASLGELLLQGKNHLDTPHLALTGFLVLSFVLVLLIFIGEGCREALSVERSP